MSDTVNSNDPYGFSKLDVTQLRKLIADQVKSIDTVEKDKQNYVGAVNDTIKEGKLRLKKAVEALRLAEATGASLAHEGAVVSFLNAVPSNSTKGS